MYSFTDMVDDYSGWNSSSNQNEFFQNNFDAMQSAQQIQAVTEWGQNSIAQSNLEANMAHSRVGSALAMGVL